MAAVDLRMSAIGQKLKSFKIIKKIIETLFSILHSEFKRH